MYCHPAFPELRQRNRWHRPSAIAAELAAVTSLAATLATCDVRPSLPALPDRISIRWLMRLPSTAILVLSGPCASDNHRPVPLWPAGHRKRGRLVGKGAA